MIGNRLYLLRKSAGLSQAELGDMLSVSHHTISAYEKEKSDPSDATKVWLARFFGVSVDYLMGLSDERYPGYAAASSDVLLLPPYGAIMEPAQGAGPPPLPQTLPQNPPEKRSLPMKTLLILLLVLAVLFLLLLLLLRPDPSARKKMAPFVGRRYAHRGLHCAQDGIPENSLPAFRRAVEAGYGIELDLHLTTDGQLVVFHDDTLDRVCGVTGRVDEKSYAELQQLRLLGTEERIPLFSEVLDIVAGKIPMIVEVKYQKNYPALCEKMMSQLRDYTGLYCVESFHPQVILWMKNHAPAVARGLLSDRYTEGEGNMTRLTPATWASQQLLFNWLTAPDFIAYNYLTAPRTRTLSLIRKVWHAPCVAWTVRDESKEPLALARFDAVIFERYRPATYITPPIA